jgi:polysaccharide biosynthesis transport protein
VNKINDYNENPAEKDNQNNPDPIIQARDESGNKADIIKPEETFVGVKKAERLQDVAPLVNHFAAAHGSDQAGQSINSMLKSVLRFKWTIILIFIFTTVPLTAVIWTQVVPKYQARAEVRVRPIIPYLVFKNEDNGVIPLYSSFMNTQVSIMRSLTVLQRVLDRPEIQRTQWYKLPDKSPLALLLRNVSVPPIERLRDNLSVRPRSQTEIIDVSFVATKADDAKAIVDSVLEQYIKYIGEVSDATKDDIYRKLTEQYKSLDTEIQGRETVITGLIKASGSGTPEELVSNKQLQLSQVQARMNTLQQQISLLEWRRKRLEESAHPVDGNNSTVSNAKQSKYSEDSEWRSREVNVRTIQHQIDNSILTAKNPEMIRFKKDLEFAQELLKLRESQLDEQWKDRPSGVPAIGGTDSNIISPSLEYQLSQAKYELELVSQEYKKQQTEYEELFKSAQSLQKENSELAYKRELFNEVRNRLEQKDMERNVPGTIDVLMKAFVPSRPYNDRRIIFTAMIMVLGLCAGGGAAALRAGRNQVVYTPQDIPRPVQLPFLGYVPVVNLSKSLGKGLSDEIKQKQFMLNESIRFMRTALLSRLDGRGSAVILITSSVSGTGKSSFANTLGHSMAQTGKNVLLIDADFYKKSLSEWYDLHNKPGFVECLNEIDTKKINIYRTDMPGLNIMPVGRCGKGMAFEDIARASFQKYVDRLRQQYQIILLDCAPILPVADAIIMSSHVDGSILVERELISHRRDVTSAIARLHSAGGRLFGFAFVGSVDLQKNGYDNYY